jgi:hypothetical protein
LKKVDDVDLATDKGVVELAKEAQEEALRLLCVGLTRARDLLVQAFPQRTQEGGFLDSPGPGAFTLFKPAGPGTTNPGSFFSIRDVSAETDLGVSRLHRTTRTSLEPAGPGR